MFSHLYQYYSSGLGDFSLTDGLDCDINQAAITGIVSLVLAVDISCILFIIRYLIVRLLAKKGVCSISLDPKSIFPFLFLVGMASVFAFSVLKIVYGNQQIVGRDAAITVLECVIPVAGQLGLILYFSIVSKFLKRYVNTFSGVGNDVLTRRLSAIGWFCAGLMPISVIIGLFPIIGLYYPAYRMIFAVVFLLGNGSIAWTCGILVAVAMGQLIHELQNHVKLFPNTSNDVRQVLQRLSYAYRAISVLAFLGGIFFISFGCFSSLTRKTTYLFLFQQLSSPPISALLIITVSRISNQRTSADMTSGKFSSHRIVSCRVSSRNTSSRIAPPTRFNSGLIACGTLEPASVLTSKSFKNYIVNEGHAENHCISDIIIQSSETKNENEK